MNELKQNLRKKYESQIHELKLEVQNLNDKNK